MLPGNYLQVKLADHPEPANIIRWATKIFPLIVEAHTTAAEPELDLDLGDGGARGSGSGSFLPAALDLQAAPQLLPLPRTALQEASARADLDRSAFYTAKLPPRVGGIGESAASRFALRRAGIEIMRTALPFALQHEAAAQVEQPSLLVRSRESMARGNEFMRSSAELADGIRSVARQLISARLRDDVQVSGTPASDGDVISGIYYGGGLPKPDLLRGYQHGLPSAARENAVGWKMQACFPTAINRGASTEIRWHMGFVFDTQEMRARAPQLGFVLRLRCLFKDQTEEWITPEASDESLSFVKASSQSPRVSDNEVQRAKTMYR